MIYAIRSARFLMILTLVALVAVAGCGGDDDPTVPTGGGDNTVDGTVSCTIDGSARSYAHNAAGVEDGNGYIVISASNAAGTDVILLTVPDTAGTYALGAAGESVINLTSMAGAYLTAGQTGTLTVTSTGGNRIVGTFSGSAANLLDANDVVVITNGAFDVDYATIP